MSQQPEAQTESERDWEGEALRDFAVSKFASVYDSRIAAIEEIATLRAQVERLQAAGQVVEYEVEQFGGGWVKATKAQYDSTDRCRRVVHYYPSTPAPSPTPAQEAADTGADEPLWRVALVYSSSKPDKQIPWLADSEADMRKVEAHSSFIRWLSPRSDDRAGQVAAPAMVPLTDERINEFVDRANSGNLGIAELRELTREVEAEIAKLNGLTVGGIQASGRVGK